VTIRKGDEWGRIGPVPDDLGVARTDADLHAMIERARRSAAAIPPLMLLGGDLMKALGGTTQGPPTGRDMAILPVDVVRVQAGLRTGWFAAHLVARRSWWRGEVVAVMNSQFLGSWDVAPRGHPNDGRFEVVRVAPAMSVRERIGARRRLRSGTHVPHPAIDMRATSATTISFVRPLRLWLDGEAWGQADSITLTVEPDALTVCV
jgi:hypothetical protein